MSDPNINPETGEVAQGRSPRFTQWVAFLVFSTITLGSSVEVKNGQTNPSSAADWAVICSAITFAITAIVVFMHLLPVFSTMFIGTRLEGVICIVLVAFWAATVAIVTDVSNGLGVTAVNGEGNEQALNGNLYYFSWAGFVTSIILMISYLRSSFGVDVVGQVHNRAARLTLWSALLASALVVMGASVRIFKDDCSSASSAVGDVVYCRRTKFAISVGAVTVALSLVVVGIKFFTTSAPFIFELIFAILLAIMNAFGVAFVTSAKGPGSAIGNLYYFSWISFLCAAFLATDCFNQFISGNASGDGGSEEKTKNNANGEIEVENMQDNI